MSEPPWLDFESPEVGAAIRRILDLLESYGRPESPARQLAVIEGARAEPETTVVAFLTLLHAALELPPLLPRPRGTEHQLRRELESKVYEDIRRMDPPSA